MNKEELINIKLNEIYSELINITWKLQRLEDKKQREDLEFTIKRSQNELEEIHHRENEYWNFKEEKMKNFNSCFGEMERINN